MKNMYKQVDDTIRSGKDVSLNISSYVDFVEDDKATKEYDFVWKVGKTECFVNKSNGRIVHLLPKQKEEIVVMGS